MNGQLGFAGLLEASDTANATRAFDQETAHLPDTEAEAADPHHVLARRDAA